jgi:hypothetical protein
MCCVMPPPSPLATRVRRSVSRSDVLAVVDVTHARSPPEDAGRSFAAGLAVRFASSAVGIVELGADALWPISSTTIIAVSWSRFWLMVTMVPSFIMALMTSVALTDILCASSATVIVSGTVTSRTTGLAPGVAAVVVAMAPAHLRAAPSRRTARAAGVAAQLERAAARGFFLEHLARRLLRGRSPRLSPCFAVGRCSVPSFLTSALGVGVLAFGPPSPRLPRPWRRFSRSRSFLRLARGFAVVLFLELFLLALAKRLRLARLFLARGDFLRRQVRRRGGAARHGAGRAGVGRGGGGASTSGSTTGSIRRRDLLDRARRRSGRARPRDAPARASCAPRPGSCATCRSSPRP